jgi:hypothetical protein
MPEYVYTGQPGMYPMGRDAKGTLLGAVETGDVRDLDEAPDHQWRPVTDEERARTAVADAERAAAEAEAALKATEQGASGTGTSVPPASAAAPAPPAAPQAAPPAVVPSPAPPASQPVTAGAPGSEE